MKQNQQISFETYNETLLADAKGNIHQKITQTVE